MGSSVILPGAGQPVTGPDSTFKSAAQPNVVSFGFEGVEPPSPLYIQRDDVLVIALATNQASESCFLNARFLLPQTPAAGQPDQPTDVSALQKPGPGGTIVNIQQRFFSTTSRGTQLFVTALGEGYLLSVTAVAGVANQRGQTFVRAFLMRGQAVANNQYAVLFEDYITGIQSVGWPGGRQLYMDESTGWSHSLQVSNPAAGADWALTAVAGQRLGVKSFSAQLVTSAAVANRNIEVIVDDGANVVWRTSAPASVVASTTQQLSGTASNNPTGVVTTDFSVVIPPGLVLVPGWRIRSSTANIQAGDQWSNIWFAVEEFLVGL